MAKGRRLPPLTAEDIVRMLLTDGWYEVEQTRHRNFRHPTKPGKAQVSAAWTGVKPGSDPWRGLRAQTGWTSAEMRELFWRG
jgi:predicted RNA binding protein YcfA (HicA-like mRNA interferase family)